MNEKEIAEIRRTLRPNSQAISAVCGCYVNGKGEVISRFRRSFGLMSEEESAQYLSIFRKTLSGVPEKNLLDIPFSNEQVTDGEEHKLLTRLKDTRLQDDEAVNAFFDRAIPAIEAEENYVILLTCNQYDVPFRAKDGETVEDNSSEVFTYLVCAICPVKTTRPALTYLPSEKEFRNSTGDFTVSAPEAGFLFPSFDNRQTNIYDVLFYTKSPSDAHRELTGALFGQEIPMTASTQEETFHTLLAESLEDSCSFTVLKTLHEDICRQLEEHKASRDPEPPTVSKYTVKEVLEECGVPEERLDAFTKSYNENFGAGTDLPPRNIVNPKRFRLETPDVVINVTPGHSDLIETRVIDGVRYILVRATEGVEFNGINVSFPEDPV